jgi:NmrA-like family protein
VADKKIIAVVGATGAQGGGLVRAILNDKNGPFAARALTRDVNSDKARALDVALLGEPHLLRHGPQEGSRWGNMFQFKRDFEKDYCGARDPAVADASTPRSRLSISGSRKTRVAFRSSRACP